MSEQFDGRKLTGAHFVVPQPQTAPSLADRLDKIARSFFAVQRKARLPKPRKAIDQLEPRLLLSGDPISATMAVGVSATLRVAEFRYNAGTEDEPDEQKELRVQLVQGINPLVSERDNVIAERRIVEIDGQKRVVTNNVGTPETPTDFLSIVGDTDANNLVIDQSVLSLADAVTFQVNLGDGNDTITGPEKSDGLIWSLDTISDGAASGKLSLLQPTGDLANPDTGDTTLDQRVKHDAVGSERTYFLDFQNIEEFDLLATRDVVVDRSGGGGVSEWKVTWDTDRVALDRYTTGIGVSATSHINPSRETDLLITGAEAFKATAETHLNLSGANLSATEIGADINAGAGNILFYAASDETRSDPTNALDISGVTQFTGTGGKDRGRLDHGVSINLGGARDIIFGSDDLQEWTLSNRALDAGKLAEAELSVDFFELDETVENAGTWTSIGSRAMVWGADELDGGESTDRLIIDYGQVVTTKVNSDPDAPELEIIHGTSAALKARGFDELDARQAGSNRLDYSGWSDDVSVDFVLGDATGLDFITGFRAVTTGSGDDAVVMAHDTANVLTGSGADKITVTRFSVKAEIDAGDGDDLLRGDIDARSDIYSSDIRILAAGDSLLGAATDFDLEEGDAVDADNKLVTAVPDDLDQDTAGIQTTDPLATWFNITTAGATGFGGSLTTRLANDPPGSYSAGEQQVSSASFAHIERIEGQGGDDDPDKISLSVRDTPSPSAIWRMADVFTGSIEVDGQTLAYEGVGIGENAMDNGHLTLSYGGGGPDDFVGDVVVDLTQQLVAGFVDFIGYVHKLIGTAQNDAMTGHAATRFLFGGDGDDYLTATVAKDVEIDGGSGTDTLGYIGAAGQVNLTDNKINQGSDELTHDNIEAAVILAGGDTPVEINALAFTRGSVSLGGGEGDDTLIGSNQTDIFFASGGSDMITTHAGRDSYVARGAYGFPTDADVAADDTLHQSIAIASGVAGNWTVSTTPDTSGGSDVTTVDKNFDLSFNSIDTIHGELSDITILGNDEDNHFDASETQVSVVLIGGDGNDILIGGDGDDTLSGGDGADAFTGNDGDDTVIETGGRFYKADGTGLLHDSAQDTAYTLKLLLPTSTETSDRFRFVATRMDGETLSTGQMAFTAGDGEIVGAIRALQLADPQSLVVDIERDNNGNISGIKLEFTGAYGGRDLDMDFRATGTATNGGAATAFEDIIAIETVGTFANDPESLTGIERLDLSFALDRAGVADISDFAGYAKVTGSAFVDRVSIGDGHEVDLRAGDDFLTLSTLGASADALTVDGGEGFDRVTVAGLSQVSLTDTTIEGDQASGVVHEGFEDFVVIGTSGDDTLSAAGLAKAGLSLSTKIVDLNGGYGLPIRSDGNEEMRVDPEPDPDSDPIESTLVDFDTGVRLYDLKVIHPDGTEDYVDFFDTAATMQDIIDSFANVPGLTAYIDEGALHIESSLSGSGALRFEGVEVNSSDREGSAGVDNQMWVDNSMLEALGLSGLKFSGNTVVARLSSGMRVLIDGLAGNDTITGSAGNDVLIAGLGSDNIDGGLGNDHLIAWKNGQSGDFTLKTEDDDRSSLEGDDGFNAQGVEIIELRGDASEQTITAADYSGDLIYRSGGAADTVEKGSGKDTIIVEGVEDFDAGDTFQISSTSVAGSADNAEDVVHLAVDGVVNEALFERVNYVADGAAANAAFNVGALPVKAEKLWLTRIDDSRTGALEINAVASGKVVFDQQAITVETNITQDDGTAADNQITFRTLSFIQNAGTEIRSNGDVFFIARAEDRRWTSGFYNIQSTDINYQFGVGTATNDSLVEARNIHIDLRAGKLPPEDVPIDAAPAEKSWLEKIEAAFVDGVTSTVPSILKSITPISANSRFVSNITLNATAAHVFRTTSTADQGDLVIRAITEGVNEAAPQGVVAGIAFGLVQVDHNIQIRSQLDLARDLDLRSVVDVANSVKGDSGESLEGLGFGVAVSVNLINNVVFVDARDDSKVGGSLHVVANTIERLDTNASAKSGKDGKVAVGIAVEVGLNTTTARLASSNLTVDGNVTVEAESYKGSVSKQFANFFPTSGASGMSVIAATGTMDGGNIVEGFVEKADPIGASGGIDGYVGKKVQEGLAKKLEGSKNKIGKFLQGTLSDKNQDGTKKEPVQPKFQISGAIGVLVDRDITTAALGYADGTPSLIVAGGKVTVDARGSVQPNMAAVAFATNEGSNSKGSKPKLGAAIAVNAGVFEIKANARIEAETEVRAKNEVNVTSSALNKIDPLGLWGANLIAPTVKAASAPDHTVSDGEVNVESGQIVEDAEGNRYTAETTRNNINLATEDFADTSNWTKAPSWEETLRSSLVTLGGYLNDNFGLVGNLFGLWAQSFGRGEKAGVAISSHVMHLDYDAQSHIGDGATLMTSETGLADGAKASANKVTITAEARTDTITGAGNIAPFGPALGEGQDPTTDKGFKKYLTSYYKSFKDGLKKSKLVQNPLGGGKTEVAIGGSVTVMIEKTSGIVDIGNVTIHANDMVASGTTGHFGASLTAAGGKGGKLSLNGSWTHTSVDTEARVSINSGSKIELAGLLDVDASETVTLIKFSGALSMSNSVAVGLSGVTLFSDRMSIAEVTGEGGGFIDATENIDFDAKSAGLILQGAIAASIGSPSLSSGQAGGAAQIGGAASGGDSNANSSDDTSASTSGALETSGAAGQIGNGASKTASKSKGGFAVSGSAVGFEEDVTIRASIDGLGRLEGAAIGVRATDGSTKVSIAGAGAIAKSNQTAVGVAGAFVVIDSQKDIDARIRGGTDPMTLKANSLLINAFDNSGFFSFSAGVAVAKGNKGVGVAGSIIILINRTEVDAALEGGSSNAYLTLAHLSPGIPGTVTVQARNDANFLQVAGAVAFGSSVGVGVAAVVAVTQSFVGTSMNFVRADEANSLGGLVVNALNTGRLDSLAFGIAASVGGSSKGAGVGMVAVNHLRVSTTVDMIDTRAQVVGGSGLLVNALNTFYIGSGAGGAALAPSAKAAFGVAAALNFVNRAENDQGVTRGTEINIGADSVLKVNAAPIQVRALTHTQMVAVAIGAAAAPKLAIAGSAAVNRTDVNTQVSVAAGAHIVGTASGGTVLLDAADLSNLEAIAGAFALSLGAKGGSVGAGVAVNIAETPVKVDFNGRLDSTDAASMVARANQGFVTVAVGGAGSGSFALGGSVATTIVKGDVAVNVGASNVTWTVANLALSASEGSRIINLAGAAGVGLEYGGVGLAVGVITNSRSVHSVVDGNLTIKSTGLVEIAAGAKAPTLSTDDYLEDAVKDLPDDVFDRDVDISTDASGSDRFNLTRNDLKSQSVNIAVAVGGSKLVGVGINVAVTTIKREIRAEIKGGATVTLSSSSDTADGVTGLTPGLLINADDASGIVSVSVGAAAAVGMGSKVAIAVAGSVAVTDIDSSVVARVGSATVNLEKGADLGVFARNSATVTAVGLGVAVAVGGAKGAGAVGFSAGVNKISSETAAVLSGVVDATGDTSAKNDIAVRSNNDAQIVGVSIAAAVTATTGFLGFAGGGAGSGNTINGATLAVVDSATIEGVDDMSVTASSDASIVSVVLGLAVAIVAGAKGGAAALGVAVANNTTGGVAYDQSVAVKDVFTENPGFVTAALVQSSNVDIDGALDVYATSNQTITAAVVAASVAVAATGGLSLSIAGAGAIAVNRGEARVLAEINGPQATDVLHVGAVDVQALNLAQITAVLGSASVAISAAGKAGIAVGIAVALSHNRIDAETTARITGFNTSGAVNITGRTRVAALTDHPSDNTSLEIVAVSVAASIAVGIGGGVGVGLSGAGADARNTITGGTVAEVSAVHGDVGSVDIEAANDSKISAVVVAVSVGIGGGAKVGGAAAIGGSFVSNHVGTQDDRFVTAARLKDVSLTVNGATEIEARNTAEIFGNSNAVSAAVAVAGLVALSGAGAGADVRNRVYSDTTVEISRSNGDGKFLNTHTLTAKAIEKVDADAIAVGAAVAASLALKGFSGAVAIGVALARNEIDSNASVQITDHSLASVSDPMIRAGRDFKAAVPAIAAFAGEPAQEGTAEVPAISGNITASATNEADVYAKTVAAAISVAFNIFGTLAVSGAGADSTNRIDNTAEVVVTRARLETQGNTDTSDNTTSGDIELSAYQNAYSTVEVGATAAAVSGSIGGGSGSIGVSIARSEIGGDTLSDRDHVTRVLVKDSALDAAGDLSITANAIDRHSAAVAAASVAVAVSFGAGIAAAGIGLTVENHSTVEALSEGSLLTSAGDILIDAQSDTTVDEDVPSMANASMIGTVTSVGLVAVSINVSILKVNIANAVKAQVNGGLTDERVIVADGDITVKAHNKTRLVDLTGVGVALAGLNYAAAGGGLEITLNVANNITAEIDLANRNRQLDARKGLLTVQATEDVNMSSDIANIAIAAAPIGLAIGAAVMESRHTSTVTARIANGVFNARNADIISNSKLDIQGVESTGVSVGTVASVINVSRAAGNALVVTEIHNADVNLAEGITALSTYHARLRAATLGVQAGIGAFGSMHVFIDSGLGADGTDTTEADAQVRIRGNSKILAGQINLQANVKLDAFGETTAGGGGGLVGVGAVTTLTDEMTANVRIENGTHLTATGVAISARGDRFIDGTADAFTVAAGSGSGAYIYLETLGDAIVDFVSDNGSNRTVVTGQAVSITTFNQIEKEAIVDRGSGARASNNVTTGAAAALANRAILGTRANIGKAGAGADKVASRVDLGNALIVGVGNYKNPSQVTLRSISSISAADASQVEAFSGGIGIAVATTIQQVEADTNVTMDGAEIRNNGGDVEIETRAGVRNTADAAIFQAGLVSANMGINVNALTNSRTAIEVANSVIEGKSVAITAGKANGQVNSTIARTAANGSLAALGISLGVALQTNDTHRESVVNIAGTSRILSAGNIFLEAEDGLFQQSHDGIVLVLAVLPYGYNVTNQGNHTESRQVNISDTARLRAGANYETVYHVRHADKFKNETWSSDVGATERILTGEERTALELTGNQVYKVGYWDPATIATDLFTGDVVRLIQSDIDDHGAQGVGDGYYRFIGGAAGGPVPVSMHSENYNNAARWERVQVLNGNIVDKQGHALMAAGDTFQSNAAINISGAFTDEIVVIRPDTAPMPLVSIGRLETLLASRYAQVREWMRQHSTNDEAVVRYQAQLEQIEQQLEDLGVPINSDNQGNLVIDEALEAFFITLPDLSASPGSIFIEAQQPASETFLAQTQGADPVLLAHRNVKIDVFSDLYMMHRIGDVVIENTKVARFSEFTGDYTEFYPGNIYINDVRLSGDADKDTDEEARIVISVTTQSRNTYTYIDELETKLRSNGVIDSGQNLPNLPPDLYVLGSIVNDLGNVTLSNSSAAVRVSGQILADSQNISSGGDFTVSTDWYHAGPNPRTTVDDISPSFIRGVEPNDGNSLIGARETAWVTNSLASSANFAGSTYNTYSAERDAAADQSMVYANGLVSIVATYVNVNGRIQSGVIEASMTVAATFEPPRMTTSIIGRENKGIPGITFGSINGTSIPLKGVWDAGQQAIVLDEMNFAGGRIEITGQVMSTGNGQLVVASGFASVKIRNESGYKLILNGIDTSKDRKGVIQITDTLNVSGTQAAFRSVFTKTESGVTRENFVGTVERSGEVFQGITFTPIVGDDSTDTYSPKSGTFYVWTEGQRSIDQLIVTRYIKTFNFIFNFDAGSGTELSREVTTLDARPLVESQGLDNLSDIKDLGGWINGVPPDDAELFVRFSNVDNTAVELVNGDLVKGADGRYWRYVAASSLQILVADLFDANNDLKDEYNVDSGTFEAASGVSFTQSDHSKREFLHNFRNATETSRSWTEGGGYLKKKTQYNERTFVTGQKKYWDIGLRADKGISINFADAAETPFVRVESAGDIVIAGDIRTASHSEIWLNPQWSGKIKGGSITAGDGVTVNGQLQTVDTNGSVKLTLVNLVDGPGRSSDQFGSATAYGDERRLDVRAGGDIDIRIGSNTNANGSALIDEVTSTGGNVVLRAAQGIYAADDNAIVSGNRVELQSSQGVIGTSHQALYIETDHVEPNSGFAAASKFEMNVVERTGDLLLVKPETIQTGFVSTSAAPDGGPISVGSLQGTVRLTASLGSILDHNFETDGALTDARLAAFKSQMGLDGAIEDIIGAQLDKQTRANYARYVEYWNLFRASNDNVTEPKEVFTETPGFNTTVANRAKALANERNGDGDPTNDLTLAEAEAISHDFYIDRFSAIHTEWWDKPFTDDVLYQRYYDDIVDPSSGDDFSGPITALTGFQNEVERQLSLKTAVAINGRFGDLQVLLAPFDVGEDSVLWEYVFHIHTDVADPALGKPNFTQLASLAGYTPPADMTLDDLEGIYDILWNREKDVLVDYIDILRAGSQAEAAKDADGAYLSAAQQMVSTTPSDEEYEDVLPDFDVTGTRNSISDQLEFEFGALYDSERDSAKKESYIETLFLEGEARDTAIAARIAQTGAADAALPTQVVAKLYPLLPIGQVTVGGAVATENANITAPEVILKASGDVASGEGRIGTLTEPRQIDFTLDVAALPEAERVAEETLRRSLQQQDIVDIVYTLYERTGAQITLTSQPEQVSLTPEQGWTKLNLIFVDLDNVTAVDVADKAVLAIWDDWPQQGESDPPRTYRLFQNVSDSALRDVNAQSINWASPGVDWKELAEPKSFAERPADVTVSQGMILADISEVQRASVRPFQDINLRANDANADATFLTMTSAGMAGIGHNGQALNIREATAGGFLRLTTTGDLVDVASGSFAASAEDYISLIAGGAIGSSDTAFRVDIAEGSTLLLQSGTDARVTQVGDGDLFLGFALTGGDLGLSTPADLKLGRATIGGTATLNVADDLTDHADDDADPGLNLEAAKLVLDVGGSVGSTDNRIEIDVIGVISGEVDGSLYLADIDIIQLEAGADLVVDETADITARGSFLGAAGAALRAGDISLRSQSGDIGSELTRFGVQVTGGGITAHAINNIWLSSDMAVPVLRLDSDDIVALTSAAAITNARIDADAAVKSKRVRLKGASIGTGAVPFRTDVEQLEMETTEGDATIHEANDLEISGTYFDDANQVGLKLAGDLNLTVDQNLTVEKGINGQGQNVQITVLGDLDFTTDYADMTVQNATLDVANNARFARDSRLVATDLLTINVDNVGAVDAEGGALELRGSWDASTIAVNTLGDRDTIDLGPQRIDGDITVRMGGAEDRFILTALNDRDVADSFTVDGQDAADEYKINRNTGAVSHVINFVDTGAAYDGADILTIDGRATADHVLVRKGFVALLNEDGTGGYLDAVERINYGADMNGRIRINGLDGDDKFFSDDTGTMFTLDGGGGDDMFQIGQMFGAARVAPNLASGDEIETNETTQGFLSVGNSSPMLVYGGTGEDVFTVYSNKAATKLFGEAGNDTFVVRAFLLKADPTVSGSGGIPKSSVAMAMTKSCTTSTHRFRLTEARASIPSWCWVQRLTTIS